MNKTNFQQSGGFRMETETLHKMQESYSIFNALGAILGKKVVISGCRKQGNYISDGVVFIDGEIFNFKGGAKQNTCIIRESSERITFENGESKIAHFKRWVEFGVGTKSILWRDIKKLSDIESLSKRILHLENKPDKTVEPANKKEVSDRIIEDKYIAPKNLPKIAEAATPQEVRERNIINKYITPKNLPKIAKPATLSEVRERSVNDKYVSPKTLPPGIFSILLSGSINNGRKISESLGSFTCKRIGTGMYRIDHNLNRLDYGLIGSGLNSGLIKVGIHRRYRNHCDVIASDDHSANDAFFSFLIFIV